MGSPRRPPRRMAKERTRKPRTEQAVASDHLKHLVAVEIASGETVAERLALGPEWTRGRVDNRSRS